MSESKLVDAATKIVMLESKLVDVVTQMSAFQEKNQFMAQKHERVLERLNLIEKRDRQRLYKLQDHVDDMQEKVNEMATHLLDWTAMD